MVAVAADQHDRGVAGDRVELGDGDLAVPAAGAVAPADDRVRRAASAIRSATMRQRLLGRAGRRQVEPLRGQRPLREVHVLVPEAGGAPATVRVDLLDAAAAGRARTPTAVTAPSSTSTSTGSTGGAAAGPIGTRRARRISRLVTGATLGHRPSGLAMTRMGGASRRAHATHCPCVFYVALDAEIVARPVS